MSFIEPIFAWNVPLVCLIFLKRSLVFPILLFFCISLHWSLRKAFFSLLAILWNSEFRWICLCFSPLPLASLLFSAICKAASVQSLSCVRLCDPHGLQHTRLPCPSPNSQSLLKLMSIQLMMWSNHLILYCPLLLLPSIFTSTRVF